MRTQKIETLDATFLPGNRCSTFLSQLLGAERPELELKALRLRGGLESGGVWRVQVRFQASVNQRKRKVFVAKRLTSAQSREAAIYREILSDMAVRLAPNLLGIEDLGMHSHLYLEAVRPVNRWPWTNVSSAAEVLERLAELHKKDRPSAVAAAWFGEWDYEQELLTRAERLLECVDTRGSLPLQGMRGSLPALRRITSELPKLRRQLLGFTALASTFIHGDVHTGNVLLTKAKDGLRPVFLDWGRSRIGSPLEDVSSWLQSLAFWEPEARRFHDRLLSVYLRARLGTRQITTEVREAYWLAGASNVLGGALLHHLWMATSAEGIGPRKREASLKALADGFRIIRRAHECWTSPRPQKQRGSRVGGGVATTASPLAGKGL
jgi:thiamine kinase-like enzyme